MRLPVGGFHNGHALLAECAKLGLEGVVSKRDAPYRSGKRPESIKTKTLQWREANSERWKRLSRGLGSPLRHLCAPKGTGAWGGTHRSERTPYD